MSATLAIELQAKQHELYAMLWHARIVSGAYKQTKREKWDEVVKAFVPCSEQELLTDAVTTMQRHIQSHQKCLEDFYEKKNQVRITE